jgi:Co/Zn/Cd efflux system component
VNKRSTWICSRNDIAANLGVLLAAAGVAVTGSIWPDVVVSLCIVTLFLWSASGVLQAAARELRLARA